VRAAPYGRPYEPAEPNPGGGWLRSKFMGLPYPRAGIAACGRPNCPACGRHAQSFVCETVETNKGDVGQPTIAQHEGQTLIRWR
jgi:hypothetical protein